MSEHQEVAVRNYEVVSPDAAALVESLRAFGYTPSTAVADLIDNSITAAARNIWLDLFWDGRDSYVSIADDGSGMAERALVAAMRPGSMNPREARAAADLGRFGLGLKTASFSQSRRLTVWSRPSGGGPSLRCWDLDYIGRTGEWRLLTDVDEVSRERILAAVEKAGLSHGTVVLWEALDRVVGDADPDDVKAHRRFFEVADEIVAHLSMVFHHFMQSGGLHIAVNGKPLSAWDPFSTRHSATQILPMEKLPLRGAFVTVQPYVLPHVSKLDQTEHRVAAGPRGWNAQQGFYVYRNNRLLVAGDWLGLGFRKEEHSKLARIRVDFPNSLDADWLIDVRKSRAHPPGPLRERLKQIAALTRETAVSVYRHRGKVIARATGSGDVFAWQKVVKHGQISYRVNREHPLFRRIWERGSTREDVEIFLRIVEESIPIPLIVLDQAERPDAQSAPLADLDEENILELMRATVEYFQSVGMSLDEASRLIVTVEPFMYRKELVAVLIEDLTRQHGNA